MADIFVSYTSADREWAKWIAQELEKLGHVPHVHEWEISGGGNIPAWMEERHQKADHILCVISKAYLVAPFSSWERQAAQWAAADKRPNFILPVFVEDCDATTMLAIVKRCDLHGIGVEDARARLVAFMTPAAKPTVPVPFPGQPKPTPGATKALVAFPGGKYAQTNIPITVPLHFLGREDVLSDIKAALARSDGRVAITALHGLRGVGKTTLAAAYADRHRADYRATWWIRAQTDSTMRADLVALGVRLGWVRDEKEEEALSAVLERLRHEGDGILLIFDNANGANEVRPYLPRSGNSQILITSTASDLRRVAALVEIEVWPNEVGADYLVEAAGRSKEREIALVLSKALGGLPLAHEQVAAYCDRLGISLADYHRRFEATPGPLLDDARAASPDYHGGMTVSKTFALAIDEAAKLHPAAEPLIVHAALLAPEPIPLFLFADAREEFGEPFASALKGDGLDEAVVALRSFALIDRETIPDEHDPTVSTDCIRLHRLVRQVAAARCAGAGREKVRRALVKAMAAVYPEEVWNDPTTWLRSRRLDAVALALVEDNSRPPKGTEEEFAYLLQKLGAYRHYALAAYLQARPLYEQALAIFERTLGSDSHETGVSVNYLAGLLKDQGDLSGARLLYERALAIHEKVFGPDHLEVSTDLGNLAGVLRMQDDRAEAERLVRRALAIDEKTVGPDDPHTATSLTSLAALQYDQGNLSEAQSLHRRALAIYEKMLGPEHPHTSISRRHLADLMLASGDGSEAFAVGKAALVADEKFFGSNHPSTKNSARITADALDTLGRADEAKSLREKYGMKAEEGEK